MPVIVLLCAVGAFATGNNLFADGTVAAFGVFGSVRERNGYPVAALALGIVMASMVEQSLGTSLIKSDGSVLPLPPGRRRVGGLHDRRIGMAVSGLAILPPPIGGNALFAWRASVTDHRN